MKRLHSLILVVVVVLVSVILLVQPPGVVQTGYEFQRMPVEDSGLTVAYCVAVTEIPQSECEALVTLYSSTDGSNWTDKTGWMATNPARGLA